MNEGNWIIFQNVEYLLNAERHHDFLHSSYSFLSKVLGYLIRHELDTKNLIKEIKGIASHPTDKYFFNVSSEAALLEEAGTLGERIFSIEGKLLCLWKIRSDSSS